MANWTLRLSTTRVGMMAGAAAYLLLFWAVYLNWLNPVWGYYGFTYREIPMQYMAVSWILALVPCVWMPIALERPSQFIYWMLYLVVYLPTMFVTQFIHLMPDDEVQLLLLVLALGFFLMGIGYRFRLRAFRAPRISPEVFWGIFAVITTLFSLVLVIAFFGQMKLVSVEDIYSQRAASKLISDSAFVGYPMTLLSGMINPVLMAVGLTKRRWSFFALGAAGQILVYACAANKSVILSIVFIAFFYLLIKKWQESFGPAMITLFVLVCFGLYLIHPNAITLDGSMGLSYTVTSLVMMRTLGTPALAVGQYHAFFANHPITYMSHLNGVNLLITYPYSDSLGITIGKYFMGHTDLNANANLWATDGIAGLWLPGILIVSVLCGVVFWLFDSFARKETVMVGALTVVFAALNLCNVSLFTTLISGGLLPLMILHHLMPREGLT